MARPDQDDALRRLTGGMRLGAALAGLCLVLAAGPAAPAAAFSDWAAVVVAGDWRAHDGGATEAFDNARRDMGLALRRAGFQSQNLRQFSTRPERYGAAPLAKSEPEAIYRALADVAARTQAGCLVYFSSHGTPQGMVVGSEILPPGVLDAMLRHACGARPTVVILSACFSGVFVPELAEPNRMVLTASRPDRSSFGCGEDNRYPYFDECVLRVMPAIRDFAALGPKVQACVAEREVREGASPPSEPQLWIGPGLRPLLPLFVFAAPP